MAFRLDVEQNICRSVSVRNRGDFVLLSLVCWRDISKLEIAEVTQTPFEISQEEMVYFDAGYGFSFLRLLSDAITGAI